MNFPDSDAMWERHKSKDVWRGIMPNFAGIVGALSDEESKRYLLGVIGFYNSPDFSDVSLVKNPKAMGHYGYDAYGANPKAGGIIVDCGAYTGDTVAELHRLSGGSCTVHAIEPYGPNLSQIGNAPWLKKWAVALGASHGSGTIDARRHPSRVTISREPGRAQVETLDRLFSDTRTDYIKIDIEGADFDALIGGREIIGRDRPTMAVCGYHKPEHMVDVPRFLLDNLSPCRLYASGDPDWVWHTHYIAVPEERAAQ